MCVVLRPPFVVLSLGAPSKLSHRGISRQRPRVGLRVARPISHLPPGTRRRSVLPVERCEVCGLDAAWRTVTTPVPLAKTSL